MDHHRHDSGELYRRIDSGCTAFAPARVNFDLAHLAICYQSREDALRSDFNSKEEEIINDNERNGIGEPAGEFSWDDGNDVPDDPDLNEGEGEPDGFDSDNGAEGIQPELIYLGEFTCTGYCPNSCCCGEYATGYTASGTLATEGRTVACNALPFGTQIMIDGHVYTVEDTGYTPYGEAWLDVFFQDHESALNFGVQTKEVYQIVG